MTLNKQQIQKQAKEIIDKFAKALSKVNSDEEGYVDRENFERVEKEGKDCDKDFKKNMLDNAPEHNDDFVLVETGGWK